MFNNPIALQRADPHIYKKDNVYYFTATHSDYKRIMIRKSDSLNGLKTCEERIIYDNTIKNKDWDLDMICAPELHLYDDKWCIYFAAVKIDDKGNYSFNMYCLSTDDKEPYTANWNKLNIMNNPVSLFGIDGTHFKLNNKHYYVFSSQGIKKDQFLEMKKNGENTSPQTNLYIAEMINEYTLSDNCKLLAIPEYDWETKLNKLLEGPSTIVVGDKLILSYSGSGTDENYCVGILWLPINADPMDISKWTKMKNPILTRNDALKIYGPGHSSFTKTEDDKKYVIAYHFWDYIPDPHPVSTRNPDRHTRFQEIEFDDQNLPIALIAK